MSLLHLTTGLALELLVGWLARTHCQYLTGHNEHLRMRPQEMNIPVRTDRPPVELSHMDSWPRRAN